MNELNKKGLLHTECMTVTGKTLGENIEGCVNKNPEVIRPIDNPYSETGGLAVLKGNLAPERKCGKTFLQSVQRCWCMKDLQGFLRVTKKLQKQSNPERSTREM